MNEPKDKTTPYSEFLKTDGGKTKSNAIEIPSISLPKGGGAIKGIDEKFSVNAINGTASFSIPLPFSPARGASPSLSLSYNSGAGNGIFGLGWNLSLPSIKRKTDKGLPQYFDSIDSDTFLFSEAEDLVPEFKKESDGSFSIDTNGEYIINEKDSADNEFTIRFYKPRIEGLFARIERWTEKTTGKIKWRVITKDNVTTLFGWSSDSVIVDPSDEKGLRIFEWLPEFVFDDKGNCTHYIYKKEDNSGFDESVLHNRNRIKDEEITYTNRYIDKVLYGNKTPYKSFGNPFPLESDFLFSTVFDYGNTPATESPDSLNIWDFRQDAFSDYKSGFEIRTTRLCKRVLLFHHFTNANEYDGLVRSLNFDYDTNKEEDFTFLKGITSYGYIKKPNGSYSQKNLPQIEFEYEEHDWNKEIKSIHSENLVHAPVGLDEQQYLFTDLFNEGLSGILTEQANGWYYKHNLGNGKFEQAKLVSPKPSFSGLGSVMQLADLDADGGKQLSSFNNATPGYFELNDDNEWQGLRSFKSLPNIDFGDANTRMLDLNGDGKPEVVISEDQVFTWYPSEGRDGFAPAQKNLKPFDEEEGPHIVFADQNQTIYLADMSGDGMTDILRIRNGEVCYWPNLGYGKFSTKVAMDNAPVFDHPDAFNPAYLRLADIDGSGTTDIIYLGRKKFTCWKNLSGNRFDTTPFEIDPFPEIHSQAKITVTDLLGNGVACIVWSSPLANDTNAPLKYIDLMNSRKPHIMVKYVNNMGKEVSMEYSPSTKFYIEDKLSGKPWVTKLHFPVHCVSKTTTEDKISGYKFVNEYKYHHGYYDHAEREFRGFGMVEQVDAETFEHWEKGTASNIVEEPLHQEPVVTKTWYHTGAFLQKNKILDQFAKDYWYKEMERQGFTATHHEVALPDARLIAAPKIDPTILDHLSAQEWQEALRACKGMGLRTEIFARDAIKSGNTQEARKKELTPFSVATHNCMIELLQPKGKNKHAIFVVKESEAITYSYERNPEDPRIAHNLNIKLDEYGNVLESAAVVYPRDEEKILEEKLLPPETQEEQRKTIIIYTENQFTNDVVGDDTYRLRLPSQVKTFELKGVSKANTYYSPGDFTDILSDTVSDTVSYHEPDIPLVEGKAQKRLFEHVRSSYYSNNLKNELPLHQLESLGVPYQNYQLAYTPELLKNIYVAKADDAALADLMEEGKFSHSIDEHGNEDANWWIRSGTTQFIAGTETSLDAQDRFYVPISYTDPYDAITKVEYEPYLLFIKEMEDALRNKSSVVGFNFRTLSPQKMKDINDNYSEIISDELGLVKAMAVMGKGTQADDLSGLEEITDNEQLDTDSFFKTANADGVCNSVNLQNTAKQLLNHATTRFVYDFDTYKTNGKPIVVASIVREEHFQKNSNSPVQLSFEYSNGIGEVVMIKVQAEPGLAYKCDSSGNKTPEDTTPFLRWIGNGRIILNNKGNPVKQYEPYFSVTPKFEDETEVVECGITPIMFYDAHGRLIRTEMPDGTFSKVEFNSWKQEDYDQNDTVLNTDWYKNRINRTIDTELIALGKDPVKEEEAAIKAAIHHNTPTQLHFDTFGRPVLQIENNSTNTDLNNQLYKTKIELDVEGNLNKVTDARNNKVMQYKYDMLGNLVYQNSMDAGQRWLLHTVMGEPLRSWDERGFEFQYEYDELNRPTKSIVKHKGNEIEAALDNIYDRIIYGEEIPWAKEKNLRGQLYRHFDTAGVEEFRAYDFIGNVLESKRKLYADYKRAVNWNQENLAKIDLGNPNLGLESDDFLFTTEYDALGRITSQTVPDGRIIKPSYNETGLMEKEEVSILNEDDSNPLDTEPFFEEYIENIDYNEKGQKVKIRYGNNVKTEYTYDHNTFRLIHLKSNKGSNIKDTVLQDLEYTYDPVGNITHLVDKAQDTFWGCNTKVEPCFDYTYDALYRLIKANGRESSNGPAYPGKCDNWNDKDYKHLLSPSDPMMMRLYKQEYEYDAVANIEKMIHSANGGSWTRKYNNAAENNRLLSTTIGDKPPYVYQYHEQHGFMTSMPHLRKVGWNFKEEVVKTIRQHCSNEDVQPETTYYQYDSEGQRIRKITEKQANNSEKPTIKDQRIYLDGYEKYKKDELVRITLSLMDEDHRFVMIENQNGEDPDTDLEMVRFQLHNHLRSSSLELNEDANVISYEEYHPFGTTSYQAKNASISAAAKRYRYTGMERDEETGLEYHCARYYLPWLGRWLSCDPIGIEGGFNIYRYASNIPTKKIDPKGTNEIISRTTNIAGSKTFYHVVAWEGSEPKEIRALRMANIQESGIRISRGGANAKYGDGVYAFGSKTDALRLAKATDAPIAEFKVHPDTKVETIEFKANDGKPKTYERLIGEGKNIKTTKLKFSNVTEGLKKIYHEAVSQRKLRPVRTSVLQNPKFAKAGVKLAKAGKQFAKAVPYLGVGAGAAGAIYAAYEGDYMEAALDTLGLVPIVGDVVDAARSVYAFGEAIGEAVGELLDSTSDLEVEDIPDYLEVQQVFNKF
jgi:RHS repeat-associated protein